MSSTQPPTKADIDRIAAISDPVVRNLQITQCYAELSAVMAQRTGPGANWCTFATWASRQAGQTIRQEDLVRRLRQLLADTPAINEAAADISMAAEQAGAARGPARWKRRSGTRSILELLLIVRATQLPVATRRCLRRSRTSSLASSLAALATSLIVEPVFTSFVPSCAPATRRRDSNTCARPLRVTTRRSLRPMPSGAPSYRRLPDSRDRLSRTDAPTAGDRRST